MVEDSIFWPSILSLASCLCAQFEKSGLPEPCICTVLPGAAVPLDYCGGDCGSKCGMAWVRLSDIAANASADVNGATALCAPALEATIEVGVVRCATTMSETGEPPTMAEQLAMAQLQMADMRAMLVAIQCCPDLSPRSTSILGYQPVGPEGGCVGGAWSITLREA